MVSPQLAHVGGSSRGFCAFPGIMRACAFDALRSHIAVDRSVSMGLAPVALYGWLFRFKFLPIYL